MRVVRTTCRSRRRCPSWRRWPVPIARWSTLREPARRSGSRVRWSGLRLGARRPWSVRRGADGLLVGGRRARDDGAPAAPGARRWLAGGGRADDRRVGRSRPTRWSLATPAAPTSRLLEPFAPEAAAALAEIAYASMAIVTLAFDAASMPSLPPISGWLVPAVEERLVKGVTLVGNKWPAVGEGSGLVIIRCSVGRAGDVGDLQRTDDELVAGCLADLAEMLGGTGSLVASRVSPVGWWPAAVRRRSPRAHRRGPRIGRRARRARAVRRGVRRHRHRGLHPQCPGSRWSPCCPWWDDGCHERGRAAQGARAEQRDPVRPLRRLQGGLDRRRSTSARRPAPRCRS